ncbi:hypothetical protein VTJ49DRAFT_5407 [Mycothermus thermophilus]|uniref:ribonuclease H n=1 Tax=Humicola insolens TaxID=85995 RepID=A0ABR3V395_HUMIN
MDFSFMDEVLGLDEEEEDDDDEVPWELPDGRLVCGPHGLVVCGKCCMDFSFMDEVLGLDEEEEDDDDEVPWELPDGRLVCRPHRLVVCEKCSMDFSFMNKEEDDDSEDEIDLELRVGTGQAFPVKFVPTSSRSPDELFSGRKHEKQVQGRYILRYTLPYDDGTVLIRTDGCCLENGQADPRAAWGFWHGARADASETHLTGKYRLEKKGPWGHDAPQTSNRAELRAVIAALRCHFWPSKGFHTVVIATDSEYVVEGSTAWVKKWVKNGWKTSSKEPVKNKDLWEVLLGEVEKYDERGVAIEFWRIPREWNTVADAAAKEAAAEDYVPGMWTECCIANF